jgi:hypothetical protein
MTPLAVLHPHLDEEELGMKHVGVLCSHLEEEELGMKHVGVLCSHLEEEEEEEQEEKPGTRFPGFLC